MEKNPSNISSAKILGMNLDFSDDENAFF